MKIQRNEIGHFADTLIAQMTDEQLSVKNNTSAISEISKAIEARYPKKLYRESRRSIAAHHLAIARKSRKIKQPHSGPKRGGPFENKENDMNELVVAFYEPTPAFLAIQEHTAVCREDTMELVAITGPAHDPESEKTARVFSAAPDMLANLQYIASCLPDGSQYDPDDNPIELLITGKAAHDILAAIQKATAQV